jgi:AAA+ ATPase superfamily predicted ATPase
MKNLLRIKTIINHLQDKDLSISFNEDEFGISRYVSHVSKAGEELNELLCDELIDESGILIMENVLILKEEGLIKDIIIGDSDSFGILTLVIKFNDNTGMVIG